MINIGKADNKKISFDLATLVDTRLLIQSNSGGGKSYAIRRLLEQSHGRIQQIVLDREGEFPTLREKYDYIIAGKDGDVPANIQTAKLLARHLLEQEVSAICDLYELKAHDRVRFVRIFLESLMSAPKSLWHPALVIVDEAHDFAPEKGQAESHQAVIDLATRGRKRGFAACLATQRLSKLHKDACAELLNKMIGRTSLDIDQARAADELGIIGKQDRVALRNLKPGQFHIYGPALNVDGKHSNDVVKTKVGGVRTTHPQVGARRLEAPPKPTNKIKKILQRLTDLPVEAEQEAQDIASLKRQNADLRRKLTIAEKSQPAVKPCNHEPVIRQLEEQIEGYKALGKSFLKSFGDISSQVKRVAGEVDQEFKDLTRQYDAVTKGKPKTRFIGTQARKPLVIREPVESRHPVPAARHDTIAPMDGDLSRPQQRILDVLASFESIGVETLHKSVLAVFSNASPTSGGYFNNLGKLRNSLGLIEYPSTFHVILTDAGREKATPMENITSLQELHDAWYRTVTAPQAKILQTLIEIYPEDIGRDELAETIGVSPSSGGYFNNLGRLRSLGAIDYPGPKRAVATDLLFPDALR